MCQNVKCYVIIIYTKRINTHKQVCSVILCHFPCFIQVKESSLHYYCLSMGEGDGIPQPLCMSMNSLTIHIRIHSQSQSTYTVCGNSIIEWGMYDIAHYILTTDNDWNHPVHCIT